MAKISELAETTSLNDSDELVVVQSGTTKKVQRSNAYGTMAKQNATAVNIDGGAIDGATVGAATPAAGTFTSVIATESNIPSISLKQTATSGTRYAILSMELANSAGTMVQSGNMITTPSVNTPGSETSQVEIQVINAGALESAISVLGGIFRMSVDSPTSGSTGTVPLTYSLNFVTTQAAANNTVTLPTAVAGSVIVCVNTSGANTLSVEPGASDQIDNAGSAVNVAANAVGIFFAKDATDWYSMIA